MADTCDEVLARFAMKTSIASASHTVTEALSLNGFGKSDFSSRDHRQIVAGLTGNLPFLVGVLAISPILMTLCAIAFSIVTHGNRVGRLSDKSGKMYVPGC
ncbi:hypothetical protein [Variovorax guangxiensis]|uniref:hypothetical protein n=1 Tax=Variovorax guangxiensis TaxID=1775474 RepID=UPI002856E119|nr:hypothetical protein [Variovorax guangxiensis]MDR6857880.1 hypothetical protein [Variovorax guangxiensis]